MRIRFTKFLLLKPKSPIGVSLLDVISNALASIILLFFILVGLRAVPPPPERMLGMLIVDYEIVGGKHPEIEVYVDPPDSTAGPGDEQPHRFGKSIEGLATEQVQNVPGIWPYAKVLYDADSPDGKERRRRFVYMNPQKYGSWKVGVIYADNADLLEERFDRSKQDTLRIKAWFIQDKGALSAIDTVLPVGFPTEHFEIAFRIPKYEAPI